MSDQFHVGQIMFGNAFQYLNYRRRDEYSGMKHILTSQPHDSTLMDKRVHSKMQWGIEIAAWFEQAFLKTRFELYGLPEFAKAQQEIGRYKNLTTQDCNNILLFSIGHTNIDFVQFLAVISCLLLLCMISHERSLRAATKSCIVVCKSRLSQMLCFITTVCVSLSNWSLLSSLGLPQIYNWQRSTLRDFRTSTPREGSDAFPAYGHNLDDVRPSATSTDSSPC